MIKNYILISFVFAFILLQSCNNKNSNALTKNDSIAIAADLLGLKFTQSETDSMHNMLNFHKLAYNQIRNFDLNNSISPAIGFNPVPVGFKINTNQTPVVWQIPTNVELPQNKNDLAFYNILQLASLIKNKKITSVELTRFYLERLKTFDPKLKCVITLTEELALQQADKADKEIAAGKYRGVLHGIPYGVKDLLAIPGYNTTWGAEPYKNQVINETATVIQKLTDAGAVLIAKLSMGELAMDDVWFGGTTKNPWDLNQGSSGSSAGSASATSAGLVPFAIGTETWGSIVSPATRCGITGLRPSYGRVSRFGAMALSWTMDKIGPICRNAEDCAIVFNEIRGNDAKDLSLIDAAFNYNQNINVKNLKIGYLKTDFNEKYTGIENDIAVLELLKTKGFNLIPVDLPANYPYMELSIILEAEAAAAFDELTRTDADSLLERQGKDNWPNLFRSARLISAVEYVQANRIRNKLIQDFDKIFEQVDVIIAPSMQGNQLLLTNLTGNPCCVVPNGFDNEKHPTSISFIGRLFDEANILAFANYYQQQTNYHKQYPAQFK